MKQNINKKVNHHYNASYTFSVNPEILKYAKTNTTTPPDNKFKKINFQKNNNLPNSKINSSINTTSTNTPQTSKYKSMLEKLNTDIQSLKTQYKESLQQSKFHLEKIEKMKKYNAINKNETINKNQNESNKIKAAKEQYEKNKVIKEKYKKDKIKIMKQNKTMVMSLHLKEKKDLDKLKQNILKSQLTKKKNLIETKRKNENDLLISKNIINLEKEKQKIMLQKRNELNAERREGHEVYSLRQIQNELEDKIKTQNCINEKLFKEYVNSFNNFLNDENKELIIV